jgi:hypothetical protein
MITRTLKMMRVGVRRKRVWRKGMGTKICWRTLHATYPPDDPLPPCEKVKESGYLILMTFMGLRMPSTFMIVTTPPPIPFLSIIIDSQEELVVEVAVEVVKHYSLAPYNNSPPPLLSCTLVLRTDPHYQERCFDSDLLARWRLTKKLAVGSDDGNDQKRQWLRKPS